MATRCSTEKGREKKRKQNGKRRNSEKPGRRGRGRGGVVSGVGPGVVSGVATGRQLIGLQWSQIIVFYGHSFPRHFICMPRGFSPFSFFFFLAFLWFLWTGFLFFHLFFFGADVCWKIGRHYRPPLNWSQPPPPSIGIDRFFLLLLLASFFFYMLVFYMFRVFPLDPGFCAESRWSARKIVSVSHFSSQNSTFFCPFCFCFWTRWPLFCC